MAADFPEHPAREEWWSGSFYDPIFNSLEFPKCVPQNSSLRGTKVYQQPSLGWETQNPVALSEVH